MVCFPDLFNLVLHCLQQQKHAGSLSWRNGALPEDEVWVKIGGNNGGSSFKLSFQIANTTNPNAICNTIPFLVFGAPDSVENLTMTLKPYCASRFAVFSLATMNSFVLALACPGQVVDGHVSFV